MTPIRRLDHVAFAVRSTEAALSFYSERLGLAVVASEEVDTPHVRLTYLDVGNAFLQLVEPLDDESEVAQFIRDRGEGLHHVCFGVDDVPTALEEFDGEDAKARPLGRGRGRVSGFLSRASHGALIECTGFIRQEDVDGWLGWLPPGRASGQKPV